MSKTICVDLGSTNSCCSIYEGGEPKVIINAEGARTTPSVVAFAPNGDELVGAAAVRQMVTNAKNTVTIVKRLIGRKFSEIKEYVKDLAYEVVEAPNGDCRIKINDRLYSPEEISAKILAKIKKDTEAYLGETCDKIVVTVPAYFSDSQRQSVRDACQIAGLECLRIINEPTSAALAWSNGKKINKKIAVYDLGGSTFDCSILDISDGVVEVLATNGNISLGGHDIDVKLVHYVADSFNRENGIDLLKDPMAMQRIKDECEKAKCALSTSQTYSISLPFITADANGPKHLNVEITRAKLEELADDVIKKTIEPCKTCLKESGLDTVDEVLLVGGQTRMPAVQNLVKEIFGIEPNKNINPDESVSLGAAVQSGILIGDNKDILLLDVTPLDIGIETMGGVNTILIPRNTTIPTKKSQVFSTAQDYQSAITVRISQGNRPMFNDNKLLGQFNLDGIPPAPRGVPQEEITVDVDANGIINVTAKDLGTNKEAHITITASSGLSKDEIEKAKAEAELHVEEDKKRAEIASEKNSAESICFSIEKTLKDNGDKASDDEKKSINEAIAKVREEIKTDDLQKIKDAIAYLNKVWEPIIKKIYPSNGASSNGQPQFSKEQMDEFMKQHPEMFNGNGPFAGFTNSANQQSNNNSDTVDAETV